MSTESIARWNAIPMDRTEVIRDPDTLKRSRDDMEADDSDDNVSLVSRTPSPPPQADQMEVDKYDNYHRGVEREVITVDTKIGSSNKGFAMLAKLGWVEGQPLGLSSDGRVEPVPFVIKNDSTGLGKTTQDVRMIETTVSQRRELDSERQTKETEDQRKIREETVAKQIAVKSEISSILRPFYCELCDKQFKNVAQYDEHTNSYAHHHKARLRDMQAAQRATFASDADKRKEKERKREEKELRKMAKAVGVKMPKPPTLTAPTAPEPPADPITQLGHTQPGAQSGGRVSAAEPSSSAPIVPSTSSSAVSRPGFSSVPSYQQSEDWTSASHPNSAASSGSSAPAFRTAGYTSLDTGSSLPPMPSQAPPPPTAAPAPPPPNTSARSGWSSVSTPSQPLIPAVPAAVEGWSGAAPAVPTVSASTAGSLGTPGIVQPGQPAQPPASKPKAVAQRQEAARSGWQQFKSGGSRRR